jgi:8-oxo-dGTP diphosphatase
VITVAFFGLCNIDGYEPKASTDADASMWVSLNKVPKLAFDHDEILATAIHRLRGKISYQPIGFELLPEKFTLTRLQKLYETILGYDLDKRNFRKKILAMEILDDSGDLERSAHRPAKLYSFNQDEYRKKLKAGFTFSL